MDIYSFFTSAVAFQIWSLTVKWYGIIIAFGMALGVYLAYREVLRQHQNTDHLLNMLLILIPAAIIGARLYYVIFSWDYYAANPDKIFAIWEGGLAIHGGVIAGILVVVLYCYFKKLNFFRWADMLAPSLILGQAIGRWGNFANHEAFGPVIEDGSFWSWVPLQVYADGAYHHPTFLYESLCDLAIFILLIILIRKRHRLGTIFSLYLILYSIARFFIEGLRMDSLMMGGLRTAQVVSLISIAAGLAILFFIRKNPRVDVTELPATGGGGMSVKPPKNKKENTNKKK